MDLIFKTKEPAAAVAAAGLPALSNDKNGASGRRAPARPRYNKFVLVAQQRSGSSYLGTLLGNHTAIYCDGLEPLLEVNRVTGNNTSKLPISVYMRFLLGTWEHLWLAQHRSTTSRLLSRNTKKKTMLGFKIMYNQGALGFGSQLFTELDRMGVKVIHLIRRNKLLQYVSDKTGAHISVYHTASTALAERLRNRSLAVLNASIPSKVLKHMHRRAGEDDKVSGFVARSLRASNTYTVYYEDLLQNSTGTLNRLFQFLGLKEENVFSRHARIHQGIPTSYYFTEESRTPMKEALSKSNFSWVLQNWE